MATRSLELRIGALSPRLTEQLARQGFSLPDGAASALQADIDAAVRLSVRGLISDRSAGILQQRIYTRVREAIETSDTSSTGESQ